MEKPLSIYNVSLARILYRGNKLECVVLPEACLLAANRRFPIVNLLAGYGWAV
jgi:hypothetical protein